MRQHSSERARIRRLRAKYRKYMLIVGIVFLVIGLALGIYLGMNFFGDVNDSSLTPTAITPSPSPEATPAVEASATVEPTASAAAEGVPTSDASSLSDNGEAEGDDHTIAMVDTTATPAPEPTVQAIVPFGESYTFTTQIKSDGSARIAASDEAYETLSFTLTVKQYMLPEDYADKYATTYRLQGKEVGAGFELVLNDYTGTATIVPQTVLTIGFESESGNTTERGYQLMDAEIAGNYGVEVESNVPKMLYKRYVYSDTGEEMKYLVVNCYNDGVTEKILFELESDEEPEPTASVTYETLQQGDKSDAVTDLQTRLIELGYLTGAADGNYGGMTAEAVRAAQAAFGLEQTGIADNAFQQQLFAEDAAQAE